MEALQQPYVILAIGGLLSFMAVLFAVATHDAITHK